MNAKDPLPLTTPKDLRLGRDPLLDAWILYFLSENGIVYAIDPQENASPEQLRFMVAIGLEDIYAPCSDEMLSLFLDQGQTEPLKEAYEQVWRQIGDLVENHCPNQYDKMMILSLCGHKYRQALSSPVLIPSRLLKRLTTIFMAQSSQDDPFLERKRLRNRRARKFIEGYSMTGALSACPGLTSTCGSIVDLRFELDMLEISRLLCLSVWSDIWEQDQFAPTDEQIEQQLDKCGQLDQLRDLLNPHRPKSLKILYLPETSGALLFDLMVISVLTRMGHRVIMAFKEGFFFDTPTIWDQEEDPVLGQALAGARFLDDNRATKNTLLRAMGESQLLVISDGTRERLNLYRVSVTFARAWKECDLVVAKGGENDRRLIQTKTEFTRDILSVCQLPGRKMTVTYKPRPQAVRIFSEPELAAKAEAIISRMRSEKAQGKTIMFYSAIVGSIPHETETAVKVLSTFVKHLRQRLSGTYIINPAEHFEEGMDADDLMYMWEKVQRSGLLNVWRFQTSEDIEQAFDLMGQQVPPIWIGKDATYSTGCTKEMQIALDVQKKQPELQITGPSPEKFLRRHEYGVGKFFDAAIAAR